MKHYEISEWVDLARGLSLEKQSVEMRRHLAEGCPECGEIARFCEDLYSVCVQMKAQPAPDWLANSAKAMFQANVRVAAPRPVRLRVELLFDSMLAPATVGIRAGWQGGWQALYRAGDCSLDLRVEPEPGSARAAVIGQISNYNVPEQRMENLPVLLKNGREVVAETRSNRFGEFQMEYQQSGKLQLCVRLDNEARYVQVPLKKVATDGAAGLDRLDLPEHGNLGAGRQ